MRVVGIVAEYNPFHRGHLYHLERAKEITGAGAAVVVMSGDFVQRGEPAVTDKYRRARTALEAGADAVLELPARFATASGEYFAGAAVGILDSLGVVTDLVYGCEDGGTERFRGTARVLTEEPGAFRRILSEGLRDGQSYPRARAAALEAVLPGGGESLKSPNNILAVEYHKALIRLNSRIKPHGIVRRGEGYLSENVTDRSPASATGIRGRLKALAQEAAGVPTSASALRALFPDDPLWSQIPDSCVEELDYQMEADDLSELLHDELHRLTAEELAGIQDMSPELAERTRRFRWELDTFTELAERLKTRQITRTRVNRALLHTVLGFRGAPEPVSAVRILGLRQGSPVLRMMQDSSRIPLVTKTADAPGDAFSGDIRASEIYRTAVWRKTGIRLDDEYRHGPVILR